MASSCAFALVDSFEDSPPKPFFIQVSHNLRNCSLEPSWQLEASSYLPFTTVSLLGSYAIDPHQHLRYSQRSVPNPPSRADTTQRKPSSTSDVLDYQNCFSFRSHTFCCMTACRMKEAIFASTRTSLVKRNTMINSAGHGRQHKIALSIITALAFFTRFCGLSYPSEIVFDEAHIMRVNILLITAFLSFPDG